MGDTPQSTPEAPKPQKPSDLIWCGLMFLAIGIGFFSWFFYSELKGGAVTSHWSVILIYNYLGKWGVLGIFGGIGLLIIRGGIIAWRRNVAAAAATISTSSNINPS